jgi:hypothetical protein
LADIANLSGQHASPRRFSFSAAIATNRNRESAGLLTRKISSTCPSNNGSVRKSPVRSNRAVEPTQKNHGGSLWWRPAGLIPFHNDAENGDLIGRLAGFDVRQNISSGARDKSMARLPFADPGNY